MKWISVEDRLPTEADCVEGRVPTLDAEGILRYGLLVGEGPNAWLMADMEPEFWLEGVPPAPTKD